VFQRDHCDGGAVTMLAGVKDAQILLLSVLLLGGGGAKLVQLLATRPVTAAFGPTALFPVYLRRPVAMFVGAAELCLGVGLLVTAGRIGRGGPASVVRLTVAVLFVVATCALIELRNSRPELGCGCFGELSTTPVSIRAVARSALLAFAALSTVDLGPMRGLRPGGLTASMVGVLAAELVLLAVLSPELAEILVRLGYSEPCELRTLPAERTLAALRKSSQWRRHAGVITADLPVDVWRELCWRYLVFPGRYGDRAAEIVFAVYLKPRRPPVRAALVDAVTGELLRWPPGTRRGKRGTPGQPGSLVRPGARRHRGLPLSNSL
jgi:hypothetical protein